MTEAPADNLFVKILAGEIPSHEVFQNADVYAFLDIYPQSPGHTLVIPKNYSANMEEADPRDLAHCLSAVRKLMPAIRTATGAQGITVLSNTGKEAGQMIQYLHFHIVPRFTEDSINISRLGDQMEDSELARIAQAIRANLN